MKKTMSDRVILIHFWLGPIHELFKSGVHFAVRWILRFLGPISFSKWSIKISNAHQNLDFCMLMNGTWAIGPFSWPIHILDQKHP